MAGMTICSECGVAFSTGLEPSLGIPIPTHICADKKEAAARGWEGDDEALVIRLQPPVELLTKVRTSTSVDWDWNVSIGVEGLVRSITVKDSSLPPPHDIQERKLDNHEDWEDAFKALGLLP